MTPETRERLLKLWDEKPQFAIQREFGGRVETLIFVADIGWRYFYDDDTTDHIEHVDNIELLAIGQLCKVLEENNLGLLIQDISYSDRTEKRVTLNPEREDEVIRDGPTLLDALISVAEDTAP